MSDDDYAGTREFEAMLNRTGNNPTRIDLFHAFQQLQGGELETLMKTLSDLTDGRAFGIWRGGFVDGATLVQRQLAAGRVCTEMLLYGNKYAILRRAFDAILGHSSHKPAPVAAPAAEVRSSPALVDNTGRRLEAIEERLSLLDTLAARISLLGARNTEHKSAIADGTERLRLLEEKLLESERRVEELTLKVKVLEESKQVPATAPLGGSSYFNDADTPGGPSTDTAPEPYGPDLEHLITGPHPAAERASSAPAQAAPLNSQNVHSYVPANETRYVSGTTSALSCDTMLCQLAGGLRTGAQSSSAPAVAVAVAPKASADDGDDVWRPTVAVMHRVSDLLIGDVGRVLECALDNPNAMQLVRAGLTPDARNGDSARQAVIVMLRLKVTKKRLREALHLACRDDIMALIQ